MLADLLANHGVRHAIVSPGSRNAPLIVALERHPQISVRVVIDERSAAFIGLGMSLATAGQPVAIVCTSGTAPLNYAPAVAEAFYRNIPLIVITADRPKEWIDQDDSQTIVQPGIYSNFIKGTFDLQVESNERDRMWMINRTINDALYLSTSNIPGPVHINVRLDEPLGRIEECMSEAPRVIRSAGLLPSSRPVVDIPLVPPHARVMIICGFMHENNLSPKLKRLEKMPNVVVMHEAQSNLAGGGAFISNIDATLREIDKSQESLQPDIVITLGGSLTSRKIKAYLREIPKLQHWSIGLSNHSVDCFRRLSMRLVCNNSDALSLLETILKSNLSEDSEFKRSWLEASKKAVSSARSYADRVMWSDFQAFDFITQNLPQNINLHVSNGTAVRYLQLFDYSGAHSIHCNRGVSGIDGCTSTAIGASVVSKLPTMLISGDMSMQYDIGALSTTFIPTDFKIIVMKNGGGGIFRYIPATRNLEELEKCFVADVRLPLQKLADAYGFAFFSARSLEELKQVFPDFISANDCPAILEVLTDGKQSADILKNFLD